LLAALLHAGPGSALSHATAVAWWRLSDDRQAIVHVSTAARSRTTRGVRVHHPRRLDADRHRGLAVTTVARTLLDAASYLPFHRLRRTVAEADYLRLLDLPSVGAQLGRGRHGSVALRRAVHLHNPRLARTLSALEERFLALCEDHLIPLPEVNTTVAGLMVDCLWRRQRLVVELDGAHAHATPAAMQRDRDRDLALRSAGHEVRRYTWQQVTERPDAVAADLRRALDAATRSPGVGATWG
jgi:very-short-patch-repair endonuclease